MKALAKCTGEVGDRSVDLAEVAFGSERSSGAAAAGGASPAMRAALLGVFFCRAMTSARKRMHAHGCAYQLQHC